MFNKRVLQSIIFIFTIALLSGCSADFGKPKINVIKNTEPDKNELTKLPEDAKAPAVDEAGPTAVTDVKKSAIALIPQIESRLFFAASDNDGHYYAWAIDPADGGYTKKALLDTKEAVAVSMFGSSGAGQSIQYDDVDNSIYYATRGASEYDGSCTNSDGSCENRIYHTDFSLDEEQEIVYASNEYISNWYLLPGENRIIILKTNPETTDFLDLNTMTGEITTTTVYESFIADQAPTLSADHTKITQLVDANKDSQSILRYIEFDIRSKQYGEKEIYAGEEPVHATGQVSPDGQYAAFYTQSGDWLTEHWLSFYTYDFKTNELAAIPYEGTISNQYISFSGDSWKLSYILENELRYYDFATGESTTVVSGFNPKDLGWSADGKYLVFTAINSGLIYIYDTAGRQTFEPRLDGVYKGISHPSNVYGVRFY